MAKRIRRKITPVGDMVLIKHDKDKGETSGGILLPDSAKLHVLTGLCVAMSERLKNNPTEYPFEELDRVLYDTRERIPVDLEPGNEFFLVDAEAVKGVVTEEEVGHDEPVQKERKRNAH